jgi:hypothetical protein
LHELSGRPIGGDVLVRFTADRFKMAELGGAYYANEAWDHWMGAYTVQLVAALSHLAGGHVTCGAYSRWRGDMSCPAVAALVPCYLKLKSSTDALDFGRIILESFSHVNVCYSFIVLVQACSS